MKKTLFYLLIPGMLVGMVSCKKTPTLETSPTGLQYQFFVHDEKGLKPRLGDFIVVHMIGKTSKDSAFFDTYRDKKPFTISMIEPTFKGSLEEGFMMMAKGDSATFIVSADSLFLKTFGAPQLPPFIEKGSKMTFTIKMEKIMSPEEMKKDAEREAEENKKVERDILNNYRTSHPTLQADSSGLLYEVLKANPSGQMPSPGDTVSLHYTGTLLDGTKFDSSLDRGEPIKIVAGAQMVIEGWERAIMKMHQGEKCRVVIPSWMAYGPNGRGDVIKPFSTLVFEMELVKVIKP